jgi:hypothetical protein
MAATTYTGTGASLTVANTVGSASFQPDFVWVKGRSGATDHALYDSVRGVQKQLESNQSGAETTETTGLTAFGSTGFTVGALAQMNTSAATYVAWQWKAGGNAVTNTDGTITTTVSASPSSGFSVMTYTGTGIDNKTIGHGLGAAPKFLIWKPRASATDWMVWHTGLSGFNYDVRLNTTAAQGTGANPLNNTAPSSTVITLRNQGDVNGSGTTIVCYAFAPVAGYSAFGKYTGNGSADGPFIYTGFRPRLMMWKRTDAVADWYMWDTTRDTYNGGGKVLWPNYSNGETDYGTGSSGLWDILSNGFKLRTNSGGMNTNGANMIYMAFAEVPFRSALAR